MTTRMYWVEMLTRVTRPVLLNFSQGTLSSNLHLEACGKAREQYMCLEILGRTLAGIAPWLECKLSVGEEENLRQEYAELSRKAIEQAVNPQSPDYCFFGHSNKEWNVQWLVDASYLALALVRAPTELVHKLPSETRCRLAECLRKTRNYRPVYNNWILFSGMVEAGLYILGEDYDIVRIDYCIRQFEQWYKGDGLYADGPSFRMDYYNSFAIQPMLVTLVSLFYDKYTEKQAILSDDANFGAALKRIVFARFQRYVQLQEESISPDGSYPPYGRSIVYRCGAFQALAQASLMEILPNSVSPAMARGALTRVIKKTLEAPGTFTEDGWLTVGLCGTQPSLGAAYITTASLYMATLAFLPLGLSPENDFWTMADEPGTWEKIYAGENLFPDHSFAHDEKLFN